jgi:hypothetical protein
VRGWLAAAAMVCVACSKGSTSTSTSTTTSTSTATSTATPTATLTASEATGLPTASVRLLDHGSEPLRPLRYTWHPDRKELMTIDLRTTVSTEGVGAHQDIPLPPLHVVVAIDPQSVTAEGDLQFAWRVLHAGADLDAGGAPPQVAEGWRTQIAPVEHLSGTAVVGANGLSKGVSVAGAGDAAPDAEMVVQVVQMLRDAAAPLPAEPVGVGARWQKVSTLDAKNGHATQTDTYTLAALHGDEGKLDDVLAQTASPQLLPPAGGAGTAPARVDSLLTSGTARLSFDLGTLVARSKLDGTTAMSVSSQSQAVKMVMHLGIVVGGERR